MLARGPTRSRARNAATVDVPSAIFAPMSQFRRFCAVFACGAWPVALASCAGRPPAPNPDTDGSKGAVVSDEQAVRGRLVYMKECQSCHGSRGKGDGPAERRMNTEMPDLTDHETAAETDEELFSVITKGSKPMPAFKNRLSEQQRWDVVRFVRVAFATGRDGKP